GVTPVVERQAEQLVPRRVKLHHVVAAELRRVLVCEAAPLDRLALEHRGERRAALDRPAGALPFERLGQRRMQPAFDTRRHTRTIRLGRMPTWRSRSGCGGAAPPATGARCSSGWTGRSTCGR